MLSEILDLARARGVMITTAESCTGGMVAAALTELPGSSLMFDRGYVTYTNAAKADMLGVSEAMLEAHGAVSEEVAAEMVRGALERGGAALAVSVTGIAGPGGSAFKPEGRVCFGIGQTGDIHAETVEFGALGRAQVRTAACNHALGLLLEALRKTPKV